MKKVKGVIGALTTISIIANMTGTVTAINIAPTSSFEYELIAEPVSETEIAVTFQSTHNPGFTEIAIGLKYDPARCTYIRHEYSLEFGANVAGSSAINTELGVCTYAGTLVPVIPPTNMTEFAGVVSITYYFEVESTSNIESDYKFSSDVYAYTSEAEGIQEAVSFADIEEHEEEIQITHSISYILGDANNDTNITVNDATEILRVVSSCTSKNESAKVSNVNKLIDAAESYDSDNTWADLFDDLIRENYACAEAADANQDDLITQQDANDVLDYYSLVGSSQPIENLSIGKEFYKLAIISV